MLLRSIYDDRLAAASYLLGCQRTGEAIVVDPQRDVDRYAALARREGLRIVAVTETHIHADFLSGSRELAELVGATVHLSDEGDADWKYGWIDGKRGGGRYPHRFVRHGDIIRVGGIELRVVHTPGHTPEHICFVVTDRGGGADAPMGILSGDFVFVGDLGRPDLLETAAGKAGASEPSAHRLYHSVQEFMHLPDWVQVWPAHGAGSACGKALGAVPQTTVGYEKRFNPAILAATDESAFVRFILEGQPEPPLYFARMKRLNRDGVPVLGGLPTPRHLSVQEFAALEGRETAILDTRPWTAFREGHLPGSLCTPLANSFTTDVGSMVGEQESVVLVTDGERVEEIVRELVRIGLDDVRGWIEPAAVAAVAAHGGRLARSAEVDVAGARQLIDQGAFVLDVRRRSEFALGHLDDATCVAHTRLAAHLKELPHDRPILVHCQGGVRSVRALSLLERAGFRATNLAGGFGAWQRAAAPVTV